MKSNEEEVKHEEQQYMEFDLSKLRPQAKQED
jgi:hypothetical protein